MDAAESSEDPDERRRAALLREYGEAASTFRTLTDIRFRLLALLPVASALAAQFLTREGGQAQDQAREIALGLFGFVVTVALVGYNTRNDQHYDTLVSRLASIERELSIPDGAFANRPASTVKVLGLTVGHREPISAIYEASITLWLYIVINASVEFAHTRSWAAENHLPSAPWRGLAALVLAFALVEASRRLIGWRFSARKELRQNAARVATRSACLQLGLCTKADGLVAELKRRDKRGCERMVGLKDENVEGLADAMAELVSPTPKGRQPSRKGAIAAREKMVGKMRKRIDYYESRTYELSAVVGHGPGLLRAARFVAVITDLSPEWLYDCATNRRGELEDDSPAAAQA